jgi:hypothetical protein
MSNDAAAGLPSNWRDLSLSDKMKLVKGLEHRVTATDRRRGRSIAQRRSFAGDPARYIAEILGATLTPQQEEALALCEDEDFVLIPAGNNLGKTFLAAAYALYRFDAVAALPDEETGLDEQGAQILLVGPDASTVYSTTYQAMLAHADHAERRGYLMPGERSNASVRWSVRPQWFVEAFSPQIRVNGNVKHTASGRHHRNQIAIMDEGNGIPETVWRAVEGMCSSSGNKIIAPYNPTEDSGPAALRERGQRVRKYVALHLSAFEHPNVITRSELIPNAISHKVIDARVRGECRDFGPYPENQPDLNEGDFLYALPPPSLPEREGVRPDGVRGHCDAPVHVFRPGGFFDPQVRGLYPRAGANTLCDPAAWDAAVDRFQAIAATGMPDRVGLDPARLGEDEPCAVPCWGSDAEALLRKLAEHQQSGDLGVVVLKHAVVGQPLILRKGDGIDIANQIVERWGHSPVNCDEGGIGVSALDHAQRVLRKDWCGVSFGARPEWMDHPLPSEPFCENLRTLLYVRAGRLINSGLVDLPPDPLLREEFLAHWLELKWRIVETTDWKRGLVKERKPSMLLCDKETLKSRKLGRSPDRADAMVLALFSGNRTKFDFISVPRPVANYSGDYPDHSDDYRSGRRLFGGKKGGY